MKWRRGLTLVEVLVVTAIIGLLVALLLPAVQGVREAARRVQCGNNIRQTALALASYHQSWNALPAGCVNRNPRFLRNNDARLKGLPDTWAAMILPWMEQAAIHDRLDFTNRAGHATNLPLMTIPVASFVCPTDPAASDPVLPNRCHLYSSVRTMAGIWYGASMGPVYTEGGCSFCPSRSLSPSNLCCWGSNFGKTGATPGMFANGWRAIPFADVRDGLSNTVLLGETLPAETNHNGIYLSNWMTVLLNSPINAPTLATDSPARGHQSRGAEARVNGIKSRHIAGAFVAMCDGAVRFLDETIELSILCALGSRKLGEPVSLP